MQRSTGKYRAREQMLAFAQPGPQTANVPFHIGEVIGKSCGQLRWPVLCLAFPLLLLISFWPRLASADAQAYRIRVWKAEDGLPQNSVTSIVQSQDGYLWLGTFNGMARFDGIRFQTIQPDNTPELPSSRIIALYETPEGILWLGTEEGDLASRLDGKFKSFSQQHRGAAARTFRALSEAPDGGLFMLTLDWQLMRFQDGKFSLVSTNWALTGTHVYGLASDATKQVWIGTDKELAIWTPHGFQSIWGQSQEPGFNVIGLGASRSGGCWVAGNERVRRFANGRWESEAGEFKLSTAVVNGMCESRRGQIWVATYGNGILCYETNGSITRFSATNGLPSDFVRCVHEDREENMWVGTEGGGLARLKPTVFRSYDRRDGLSGDCILSVCEGDDGELWIGTNGNGVNRLKNGEIRQFGSEQGLTNEFVWSVYADKTNGIWAGTWGGGLFQLQGEKFVSVPQPDSPNDSIICALFQDSRGSLWLGQQRNQAEVCRVQGIGSSALSLPSGRAYADVRAVTEDRAGNLWIGTFDDGLYRINDGQTSRFGTEQGLSSERIRALYADSDNVLWIGTSRGGLNKLKGEQFSVYTTQDGLADDYILHIEEDHHGYLWCSSGIGVFRVAKKELRDFGIGEVHSIRCFSYTKADGLPSLECTGGCQPSGCKTRDGRLWFPTVAGLAVVSPDNIPVNPLAPPVHIEQVIIEGDGHSAVYAPSLQHAGTGLQNQGGEGDTNQLKVPPGKQRFEFHYTGLSFTAPEKVHFRYRLENLEEQWVEAGTRREAHYSYLLPGKYNFHVVACNNDGVWNDVGASLAIIVLPHFWQTWSFRFIAAALILLVFGAVYEIRLASERRLTRLRLRIARDLHDEIGSNLGTIALLGEVMEKQPATRGEEAGEIRRIATQTVESLRDIVWFLDPASDKVEDLVLRLKETARAMLPGITLDFQITGETTSAKPSLELRRNLFPIFKEALHNIARHSHAGRVQILVEFTPPKFLLKVSDDGIGFDESRVRAGNGMKNLRRRSADLKGSIEIRSTPGKGTALTFEAPIP